MAVVDTSVLISALTPSEPQHIASKAWLNHQINTRTSIDAPSIILAEVAAALSRGQQNAPLANLTVQTLRAAPYLNLVAVSTPLSVRAGEIAANYKIRGRDAIYVALAESLNTTLVTLDKQQKTRSHPLVSAQSP